MIKFFTKHMEYIVVFIVFYLNYDAALISDTSLPFQVLMFGLQGITFIALFNRPRLYRCDTKILLLMAFIILLCGLLHDFNSLTYPYRIFLLALCFQYVTKLEFTKVQKAFVNITFVFALISIIFHLMLNITGTIGFAHEFSNGYVIYGTNYVFSYLVHAPFRNEGIFREPGAYQIYLNIALLCYYNMHRHKVIDKYSFVLILAVFTSLSTAGILLTSAIVGLRYLHSAGRSIMTTMVFVLFLILAYWGISSMSDRIFGKLAMGIGESGSVFARYYSIFLPMKIALDYPIFGCGAMEFNSIIGTYRVNGQALSVNEITNTFTVNFATTGVLLGILYLFFFCKGALKLCNSMKHGILYMAVAALLYFNENCLYSVLFSYIVVLGLVNSYDIKKLYNHESKN